MLSCCNWIVSIFTASIKRVMPQLSCIVYGRVYGWTGVGRPGHITTCISDHNWCPVTPQLCGSPSSQLGHNTTSSSAEMWKKLEQDVRGHDKKTLKHETRSIIEKAFSSPSCEATGFANVMSQVTSNKQQGTSCILISISHPSI